MPLSPFLKSPSGSLPAASGSAAVPSPAARTTISDSRSTVPPPFRNQSVMSPFGGHSGQIVAISRTRTRRAFPVSEAAILSPRSRPAASLSQHDTTSAPRRTSACRAAQNFAPPLFVVARRPIRPKASTVLLALGKIDGRQQIAGEHGGRLIEVLDNVIGKDYALGPALHYRPGVGRLVPVGRLFGVGRRCPAFSDPDALIGESSGAGGTAGSLLDL